MSKLEDHKRVISILYGLLSNLHYASEDVDDYVKKRGHCSDCYRTLPNCECAVVSEESCSYDYEEGSEPLRIK